MKKYNVGFTAGIFDILHAGHIDTLRRAKEQCEYLIVAVGTDEFLKWRKNRAPVICYEDSVEIIRSIRYVDEVVPEKDLDKVKAFHQYHFDVMFAGIDHIDEPIYIEATRELKQLGIDTVYLPHIRSTSSTKIRQRIIELSKAED